MYYFTSYRKLLLTLGLVLMSFSYTHAANNVSSALYPVIIENYKQVVNPSSEDYINKVFAGFTVGTDPKGDNDGPQNLEGLIFSYCSSVLINGATVKDSFLYSARQSAFVYLLCKNINSASSLFFVASNPQFTGYFKESDFARLGLPVKNDEKHLVYLYADDLFNTVIKEYFAIKQADVYGLQTDDESKSPIEDQVNKFSAAYFKDIKGISICDKSEDLGKHFPKTCTYMTQYLRSQKKMFKNLNVLSSSGIYTDYAKIISEKPDVCTNLDKVDSSYNIILCGLRGDSKEKTLSSFINLVYNELFYYNLFVEYYSLQITKNPDLFKDTTMSNGVGTISAQQASRINEMKTELKFARQAMDVGVRMLRNAYITFPLHIGFLMYRESLQDFGQAMAKIATPVYTLFGDKFRNVQCLPQ